jgi:CubicO group peptidase (beta-lactamase class C family)
MTQRGGIMNSKSMWRATLPLIALLCLSSAQAENADDVAYYIMNPDKAASETTLRAVIAPLFDADKVDTTQAVLVMHDGRIVAERYAPGFDHKSKFLSRSIAKSITSVLVGLMVSDGRLALDSPVPLDTWDQQGDPRSGITLRHLLTMTTGLQHSEDSDPIAKSDTVRMLFTDGAQDMATFAESKPIASRPGTKFNYSTANYVIIADLMTRMLTDSNDPQVRRDAMNEFIMGRLADPVGLKSLTGEYDARGTLIGGAMMHLTTRDYARFGQFLLQKGKMKGRQILSPRWVEFMTKASTLNPDYGGGVWINRQSKDAYLFNGRGARTMFACLGHHGQFIVISPSQRLVIVRLGITNEAKHKDLAQAIADIAEVFPVD